MLALMLIQGITLYYPQKHKILIKLLLTQIFQITAASGAAAADNINGMTIHGALGLHVKGSKRRVSPKLQRLWAKKEMLTLDEISMVSLSTLQEIENQLRAVRDREEAFGDLKVVSLCGDFFQFPPVLGRKQCLILMKFLRMPRVSACGPHSGELSCLMSKCTNKMIWNIVHYYAESGLVPLQWMII